ncbi:MAG: histone [Candidatus Bathyarchaeia archaeon]
MTYNKNAAKGTSMAFDGDLSIAAMQRICKKAGAQRVSKSAANEMAKVLEDVGLRIAEEAIVYAMHTGRKTVKARDIEIAARKVMKR